ncbi:hypothetical protein F5B17DRAFT_241232 [Nemania serpens]|nr:hypothetical protein F5B17DRAFT_241232 [Nemania serpens]
MASSTNYNHHPLPAPPPQQDQYPTPYQRQPAAAAQDYQYQPRTLPQQPQQYQQHPHYPQQPHQPQQPEHPKQAPEPSAPTPHQQTRRSRAFSFRSDKSQKSTPGPTHKIDLTETSAEKEAKRLHSKADPTMALSEREPAMEAQTLSARPPLRAIQHKDLNGNPIADPDRSNPTRSRWERPLDTIRGFEAAIDGGYNRKSFYKPDADPVAGRNRRSSYYGSNGRPPQDGWQGAGRPNRAENGMFDQRQSMMMMNSRDSSYEGFDGGPYNNGVPGIGVRNKFSRNQSEPYLNAPERNVYPTSNNHRSYETVASGSGTGSMGEPTGYQTDLTSSENSSIDRQSPPKRQEQMNDYGISFGQSPSYQAPGVGLDQGHSANPPSLPRKDPGSLLRKSSKAPASNEKSQERPGTGEKRKSWFVRRFSKNS